MKKITLSILSMVIGAFVFAQAPKVTQNFLPGTEEAIAKDNTVPSTSANKTWNQPPLAQVIIWSEDFNAGIPGGWIQVPAPACALWEYRGPATTPNNSVGSQGACETGNPLQSPTQANGFVIFDSNYLDDNIGPCGVNVGSGACPAGHVGVLQTDAINCVGYTALLLKFNQYIRNFQSTQKVFISTDGGGSWTEIWDSGITVNNDTPLDDSIEVNISAWAANQADVRFQFEFDGSGAGYYEWQLDDIKIVSGADNDLAIDILYYNTNDETVNGKLDSLGYAYYTHTPVRQANMDSIIFGVEVLNQGANDQPGSFLTVDVTGPNTYTGTSATKTILSSTLDTLICTTYFDNMPDTGMYTATFTVSSDSVDGTPADNTASFDIHVSDTVYAWDNNNYTGWGLRTGANDNAAQRGMAFEIFTTDTVTSVSVYIQGLTLNNSMIQVHIYDVNDLNVTNTPLVSGMMFDLGNSPTGWYSLPVTPTQLPPGYYLAAFEAWTDTIYVAFDPTTTIPTPDVTAFYYDPGAVTWYYSTSNTPYFIRMNTISQVCGTFAATVGAFSNESALGAGDGSITVNATGGTPPYTYNWSSGGNGPTESNLNEGIYSCTITDANGCTDVITQVLVITSIEEVALNASVSIFPNPSNGEFTIEFTKAEVDDYNLEISNILGQEVYSEYLAISGSFTKQLDLKSLEKGVYFLKVSNSEGAATYKLVLE